MIVGLWLNVIASIAVLYTVSSMLGYLLHERIVGPLSTTRPFFVRLPIYISLGLLVLIPITFLAGLFAITSLTLFGALAISSVFFVRKLKDKLTTSFLRFSAREEIVPFLLCVFSSAYFIGTIGAKLWPPPGDIMSGIGPLVSLIEYNGRLPFSPNPILILYPPGFHILTATFNSVWRLYPAQAIYVLGGAIAGLIPLVVYSLTFFLSRSKALSLMAFSCTFISDPLNLERWVMGYFYNGPYVCMTGFLFLLTFASVLATMKLDLSDISTKQLIGFFVLSILSSISLILTYPSFAIPIFIALLIVAFCASRNLYGRISTGLHVIRKSHAKLVSSLAGLAGAVTAVFALTRFRNSELHILFGYLTASYTMGEHAMSLNVTSEAYRVSTAYLLGHVLGILSLVGMILAISVLALRRKTEFGLEIFYLVMGIPFILSLDRTLYPYLVVILPTRIIVSIALFSWVLIYSTIAVLLQKAKETRIADKLSLPRKSINSISVVIALVSIVLFSCLLLPYVTGQINRTWLWFDMKEEDFAALEWIDRNVSPTDLVLDDATFTGQFSLSMSVKNITYCHYTWVTFPERANDLLEVWEKPSDLPTVYGLLSRYNVSYILVTSERGQLLYHPDLSYSYVPKNFTNEQYTRIFDQFPFLEIAFRKDFTTVYKVSYGKS